VSFMVCSDGSNIDITDEEFSSFRVWLKVEPDLEQRISQLFWLDMFIGYKKSSLNCQAVLDTVKNLEEGEPKSGVRPATRFKRRPLKGLWQKHHYSGANLPMNVANNLTKGKLAEVAEVAEVAERLKGEDFAPEDREARYRGEAMKLVTSSLAHRSQNQSLTGELIIFAKSDAGNFYLSLGYHDLWCPSKNRDQFLIDRIKKHCLPKFPDVLNLIE
jgi:hypothetical protein